MSNNETNMEKTIADLNEKITGLRTNRANPDMIKNIQVNYYGSFVPLQQVASISTPDPSQFSLNVFDQEAVKDSHELDWKFYKEGGCTGIDIHTMNGGDYASNGTYMFVARFNSMEELGGCMDHMWGKSDYMKSTAEYHSKIKIIKNFNARVLKSDRFK